MLAPAALPQLSPEPAPAPPEPVAASVSLDTETSPAATPGAGAEADEPEPLPVGLLADIAAGIAQVPDAWRDLVHHDPERRRPVRLLATEAYEVWVIGWTRGQHVRPHDHGGSAAAVLVIEGELTEVDLLGNRRSMAPGNVLRLGRGIVHDVVNQTDEPATSVHVYSPPLSRMTYYDPETWEPDETVRVQPETPVLSVWQGSRMLHPTSSARARA